MCLTNKAVLSFFDWRRTKRLQFVNIRDADYTPTGNGGVTFEDAMRHFHVIEGATVAEGSEAVLLAYSKVGLGWLMAVLRFPLIRWAVDLLYAVVSKHRYTISKFLPGGKALASAVSQLKDVETAAMGGGCDDEEECMLDCARHTRTRKATRARKKEKQRSRPTRPASASLDAPVFCAPRGVCARQQTEMRTTRRRN